MVQPEGCPFRLKASASAGSSRTVAAGVGTRNKDWWPNQLDLSLLQQQQQQTAASDDPIRLLDPSFDYATAFQSLDLRSVKKDLAALMTNSQDWWPADYGHYGPFFVRMAWHSAGTYRTHDGRGGGSSGQLRFAPLNSWPDNTNLDKARRLLLPIKLKYGSRLSWADLMILAGNVALETMGFRTFGFAGGREDVYRPEEDVNWGVEKKWLGDEERYANNKNHRELDQPLAAVQMGLIYVNPEGPAGHPDPVASAADIRETFGRMAMNDEETVALVAGGHTFGKCHGAAEPDGSIFGPEPEGAALELQGLGWKNTRGTGHGADTITSGIEGAWTAHPTRWDNGYFGNLFSYEWELSKSPAGAHQWKPAGGGGRNTVPDAHDPFKRHAPIMTTADLALLHDPAYNKIARYFKDHPEAFAEAFAKAWYKLTHRDMGPHVLLLGPEVPPPQLWQDYIPPAGRGGGDGDNNNILNPREVKRLKEMIWRESGLSVSRLVTTAWASASTFRQSDKRGGANGARIRLLPQKNWKVNDPMALAKALAALERIQQSFNNDIVRNPRLVKVSLADTIVLGGCIAVEAAARTAGCVVTVPFQPGRMDVTQEMTDVNSFAAMEPLADGFRNYYCRSDNENLLPQQQQQNKTVDSNTVGSPEAMLVDKAQLLSLTIPEMTILIGGLRVLGVGTTEVGVFTDRKGVLTNDFFVNLLNMDTVWKPVGENLYQGYDSRSGHVKYKASRVDLVFGSNSILRAAAEVFAADDTQETFCQSFANAFAKVMDLDRFDLKLKTPCRPRSRI